MTTETTMREIHLQSRIAELERIAAEKVEARAKERDELWERIRALEWERDKWRYRAEKWLSVAEEMLPALNKAEAEGAQARALLQRAHVLLQNVLDESDHVFTNPVSNETLDEIRKELEKP